MFDVGIWGTVADWVVVSAAGLAALIAWRQIGETGRLSRNQLASDAQLGREDLHAAAKAARDQAEIARASLVLEIDRDFESAEMQECRLALRALHNEIKAMVQRNNANHNSEGLQAEINKQFGFYLNRLWKDFKEADRAVGEATADALVEAHLKRLNDQPEVAQPPELAGLHYQRLTRIFGWLERVAYMVNQGLLPKDDVVRLYDFIFIDLGGWVEGHIKSRREDGPRTNPEFMIETTSLRNEIIAAQAAGQDAKRIAVLKTAQPAKVFARSGTQ